MALGNYLVLVFPDAVLLDVFASIIKYDEMITVKPSYMNFCDKYV